jgi:DNA repair protein RadC
MPGYVRELTCSYRRVATSQSHVGVSLRSPEAVAALVNDLIGDSAQERFIALHLDIKNRLKSYQLVGLGTVASCPVSVGELAKGLLLAHASALIVAHNHPSGDPAPSKEDNLLTDRLRDACQLIDIPLLDHVILGDEDFGYYSYAEMGKLEL